MSSQEPTDKKKPTKTRTRRNFKRDLDRIVNYCAVKIEVLESLERSSTIEIQIGTLKDVLAKAEGK